VQNRFLCAKVKFDHFKLKTGHWSLQGSFLAVFSRALRPLYVRYSTQSGHFLGHDEEPANHERQEANHGRGGARTRTHAQCGLSSEILASILEASK
jgi:hypothetical protein